MSLHVEGGQWISEEKGVEKVGVDYFDDYFFPLRRRSLKVFLKKSHQVLLKR